MAFINWIIAYNNQTDECRFMKLLDEWMPFKYHEMNDIQPEWQQIGVYKSQEDAFLAFMAYSVTNKRP